MKKAKRLVSLLLAFVMLMSLTVGVGASGLATKEGKFDGGQITVTEAVANEKYDLYQMMALDAFEAPSADAELDSNDNPIGGKYSYVMTTEWAEFLDYVVPDSGGKKS